MFSPEAQQSHDDFGLKAFELATDLMGDDMAYMTSHLSLIHIYYSGSRIPDLYGSINTDFSYKNVDLSIVGTYSIVGKVYDSLYAGSMEVMYAGNTWNKHALRRWQQPGDITDCLLYTSRCV